MPKHCRLTNLGLKFLKRLSIVLRKALKIRPLTDATSNQKFFGRYPLQDFPRAGRLAMLFLQPLPSLPMRPAQSKAHRFLFLVLFLALVHIPPAKADTIIVANPDVTENHLPRSTARLLFSLRRTHWRDGRQAQVFVLGDNHPIHREFTRKILQLYPRQLRRVWDRQTYSGTGQAPEVVSSPAEMRNKVATTPGSIGYLPKEMVDESIKPIEVQ